MKKTVIASLAVLASAAVLTVFALGGAGKFGDVQVNANPIISDRSVTFDANDTANTTIEKVGDHYAICTTTDNGNKVGVLGFNAGDHFSLVFRGAHFETLDLQGYGGALVNAGTIEFSHITGFKVTFAGNLKSSYGEEEKDIVSEKKYDVSLTPSDVFYFYTYDDVDVQLTSLTIWYSC